MRRRRKKISRVVGDISVPEVKGREEGCVVVKGGGGGGWVLVEPVVHALVRLSTVGQGGRR